MTRDQYDALRWCYDMAAQDHRVPETVERLTIAREALRENRPHAPGHVPDDRFGFREIRHAPGLSVKDQINSAHNAAQTARGTMTFTTLRTKD